MNSKRVVTASRPMPRGIHAEGPAILSYGFRPFFLGAGVFAVIAMVLWIGALTEGWAIGGSYGPLEWHAHEMLFGFAAAAMTGFLMTAIPNWTGRLPVAGLPLLALFLLWVAGRIVMLAPGALGDVLSAIIESSFLPLIGAVAAREILAGKNWKNLKILIVIAWLSTANIAFHVVVQQGGDPIVVLRATIAAFIILIALVGGRIVPSFTRNWLVKAGATKLPRPTGRVDRLAMLTLLLALLLWVLLPEGAPTAVVAALAAVLQAIRLWRWRGWATLDEPLLGILHLGYSFLPIGLVAIAMAAMGWASAPSVLHVLTVGAIGNMTLAVMTRASLAHTGRPLAASWTTALSYLALLLAAVCRPFAEMVPQYYHVILAVSGAAWIAGFCCFVAEYGPMLVTRKLTPVRPACRATPPARALREPTP
jgi:uncharacterized protein involved in response to NO